jgi:DNA invertase Pin-like site-specific DNA recombinase
MIFHVIAAMAKFEPAIIRERTIAGIAAAGEGTASRKTAIAHGRAVRLNLQRPLSGLFGIGAGRYSL